MAQLPAVSHDSIDVGFMLTAVIHCRITGERKTLADL